MVALVNSGCKLEISANGSSWTDISGYATSVDPGDMVRNDGEVFVFSSDKGEVTTGKLAIREISIDVLYTEGASDVFDTIRDAIEANTTYYVRWSPQGGSVGELRFTSDAGKWISINDPMAEADSADAAILSAVFKTPFVTKSTIAS